MQADFSGQISIGKKKIGAGSPCFIIAEIGINFDGEYEKAVKLIDSAYMAGCDAVKFQLFKSERMYVATAGKYKTSQGKTENIIDIVKKGELPEAWILKLKKYANNKGLEFFATACDEQSADILQKYNVPAYKIASYEITHIPLLRHIAKKQKPVIFSCGGADLKEVCEALDVFRQEKNKNIALLHCVAQYGAPLENLNLNIITALKHAFPEIVIGYSDHSKDAVSAPVAAVKLGAKIIEKHITLDKNSKGPDHSFALEPFDLKKMVQAIRQAEQDIKDGKEIKINPALLGSSARKTYENEKDRGFAYRCVFAKKDIKKGQVFSKSNIAVLRPGQAKRGLEPKYYEVLVKGRKATRNIKKDTSLGWDDILLK